MDIQRNFQRFLARDLNEYVKKWKMILIKGLEIEIIY